MTTTHQRQGSWETITGALERAVGEGRPGGSWTKYCCPVHEAGGGHHNPSLGVKYDAGQGRTVVKCFAGCDNEDVLAALDLRVRDLYDAPITRTRDYQRRPARPAPKRQPTRAERAINAAGLPLVKQKKDLGRQTSAWRQVTVYPYAREDGTIAGDVVRREAQFEHGRDKRFHQHRWDPQSGERVDGGFEPIPFQLPRVLAAVAAGETVYVVEGEKDVLTAEAAGLTATCNAGSSWTPEHARWLDGAAEVVIVADRDAPGYRRADRVLSTLEGRVGRVRVMQAATGKDLTDHIAAGHDLDDLMAVPYLDPLTTDAAAAPAAGVSAEQIAESAGIADTHPDLGGDQMTSTDVVHHDDTVDHMGQHFSKFVALLFQQLILLAQRAAEARRRAAELEAKRSEEALKAFQERQAAERKLAETRLAKLAKAGWDNASRSEIAAALQDAATWASDSETAKRALNQLTTHVHHRFGVHIDTASGHVTVDAPELSGRLARAEQDRATAARLRTAQDEMVTIVATDTDLDESTKAALYQEIHDWQRNPNGRKLSQLEKRLKDAKVPDAVRTRIRFVAAYLGPEQAVPVDELGAHVAVQPTAELRKLEPLVDAGEEAKPRIDALLVKYQDWARTGRDTAPVTEELARAVAVLTPEDQQIARDRGVEIRTNPAGQYKKLWPKHVDRDELAAAVRVYAAMAPQVEAQAVTEDALDADWFGALRERSEGYRRQIQAAVEHGEGLHALEKAQLKAVLRDIEAGKTDVPALLFVDDRSAAAVDTERADEIARELAIHHRRQLTEILASSGAPAGVAVTARDEIETVFDAQTGLAAGRSTLGDYETRGTDARLLARLATAGVSEPLRNRVRHHIDDAAGEAAITGKQARRIADRWVERRDTVVAARAAAKPAAPVYDSAAARADFEARLRRIGLSEDVVAARVAAAAGHAHPPQAAVSDGPGKQARARTTRPGSGVYRANHRGRGDQRGYGK